LELDPEPEVAVLVEAGLLVVVTLDGLPLVVTLDGLPVVVVPLAVAPVAAMRELRST